MIICVIKKHTISVLKMHFDNRVVKWFVHRFLGCCWKVIQFNFDSWNWGSTFTFWISSFAIWKIWIRKNSVYSLGNWILGFWVFNVKKNNLDFNTIPSFLLKLNCRAVSTADKVKSSADWNDWSGLEENRRKMFLFNYYEYIPQVWRQALIHQ